MTISYDTVEQAQKVFAALSEGGKITMPMGDMFWAKAAGMCLDKYGVSWSVNGALKPVV
jgi:PhnB protein